MASIDDQAFETCTSLESITISESITNLGSATFYDCSSLSVMIVKAKTPPAMDYDTFNGIASDAVIYVPFDSVDSYKKTGDWRYYASKIQAIP